MTVCFKQRFIVLYFAISVILISALLHLKYSHQEHCLSYRTIISAYPIILP
jgi:hypothetical protein